MRLNGRKGGQCKADSKQAQNTVPFLTSARSLSLLLRMLSTSLCTSRQRPSRLRILDFSCADV